MSFKYKDDHYVWALQNKENGLLKQERFKTRDRPRFYRNREMARYVSRFHPDYKVVKVTLEYHIEESS